MVWNVSAKPALTLYVDRRSPAEREMAEILGHLDSAVADFSNVSKHLRRNTVNRDLQEMGLSRLVDAVLRLRTLAELPAAVPAREEPNSE